MCSYNKIQYIDICFDLPELADGMVINAMFMFIVYIYGYSSHTLFGDFWHCNALISLIVL